MRSTLNQTFRSLARQPHFTIPAMLALALGLGANILMFTLIDRVLLNPLPYPEANRITTISEQSNTQDNPDGYLALADFMDIQRDSKEYEQIAAFQVSHFNLAPSGETQAAEQVTAARVTADFFSILGARPILGRLIQQGDDDARSSGVVVLSEGFWKRRYGSKADVLGKQVLLNGHAYTIVGVAPASFLYPREDVQAWTSLALIPSGQRSPTFLRGIARLKQGASIAQARAELNVIASSIRNAHPTDYRSLTFPTMPITESVIGHVRTTLWITAGMALLLFVIAVTNVANITFARGLNKQRDIAVQSCLGARRQHIVCSLLLESLIIAGAGSVGGGLLAWIGIGYLRSLNLSTLPRMHEITMDWSIVLAATSLGVIAAAASGLLPALRVSKPNLAESLRAQGRTATDFRRNMRIRNSLVVAEIALSFALLTGGSLMARSFLKLSRVDVGFQVNPDDLLVMLIYPTGDRYTSQKRIQLFSQLSANVKRLPGVEDASTSFNMPPNRVNYDNGFEIEGNDRGKLWQGPNVPVSMVSPGFFHTIGLPVQRGRPFTYEDTSTSPPVVIVSERFVKAYMNGRDPVGKRLRESDPSDITGNRPWMEIVGVVADMRFQGARKELTPAYYRPSAQLMFPFGMYLVVRGKHPLTYMNAIEQLVHSEDRGITISVPETMAQVMDADIKQSRFNTVLMDAFAMIGILLTAIGTYGVISYSVAQRKSEIGIRLALGAPREQITKQIIKEGLLLTVSGVMIGSVGAVALGKAMTTFLFEVSPFDPWSYALGSLLLFCVSILACYLPSRRAASLDPLMAIREE